MKHYCSLHWEAARRAGVQLFRQPFATLLILLMLSIAMTLPLALYLGVQSAQAVLGKLNESPQITLYMEQSADQVDVETVKKLLSDDKRITETRFIGKDQGLQELQQNMDSQDLVSMLDSNPLPDVFIVSPKAGATPTEIEALRKDTEELPMVESSKLDSEWLQTLYHIDAFVHQVLWFLAVTLSVAFVLVAYNTMRLQILSKKEEIEITKLLGAPSSFIRRPFLYQAAWQSVIAAAISLCLCAWVSSVSRPLVNQIFQPYGVNLNWRFFYAQEIFAVLLITILLGTAGAWLAVRRHLIAFKSTK